MYVFFPPQENPGYKGDSAEPASVVSRCADNLHSSVRVHSLTFSLTCVQMDGSRSNKRSHGESIKYKLVAVAHGNDIASLFELDPTTLQKTDSFVPR